MSNIIDLREMTPIEIAALFPDNGKEIDAITEEFVQSYTAGICNLTLNTFCSMYGYSFNYIADLTKALEAATKGYVSSFLQSSMLSSVKVLGHYQKGTTHIFPYLPYDERYYLEENRSVLSMVCFYLKNDSYGIDAFVVDNTFSYVDDDIRTFKDVYHFLCKHTDITDYPYQSL